MAVEKKEGVQKSKLGYTPPSFFEEIKVNGSVVEKRPDFMCESGGVIKGFAVVDKPLDVNQESIGAKFTGSLEDVLAQIRTYKP